MSGKNTRRPAGVSQEPPAAYCAGRPALCRGAHVERQRGRVGGGMLRQPHPPTRPPPEDAVSGQKDEMEVEEKRASAPEEAM